MGAIPLQYICVKCSILQSYLQLMQRSFKKRKLFTRKTGSTFSKLPFPKLHLRSYRFALFTYLVLNDVFLVLDYLSYVSLGKQNNSNPLQNTWFCGCKLSCIMNLLPLLIVYIWLLQIIVIHLDKTFNV